MIHLSKALREKFHFAKVELAVFSKKPINKENEKICFVSLLTKQIETKGFPGLTTMFYGELSINVHNYPELERTQKRFFC